MLTLPFWIFVALAGASLMMSYEDAVDDEAGTGDTPIDIDTPTEVDAETPIEGVTVFDLLAEEEDVASDPSEGVPDVEPATPEPDPTPVPVSDSVDQDDGDVVSDDAPAPEPDNDLADDAEAPAQTQLAEQFSVSQTDEGLSIDRVEGGDAELIALKTLIYRGPIAEYEGETSRLTAELIFYAAPEGTNIVDELDGTDEAFWPFGAFEEEFADPDGGYEERFGLQEITRLELGDVFMENINFNPPGAAFNNPGIDTRVEAPTIDVNGEIQILRLEQGAFTPQETFSTFELGPLAFPGNVSEVVASDTLGGDGSDFFIVEGGTPGLEIDAGESGDYLITRQEGTTLRGGDGEDTILSSAVDAATSETELLSGGAGADLIYTGSFSTEVFGGAGDDRISAETGDVSELAYQLQTRGHGVEDANVVVFGGAGDDGITASGNGVTAYGGDGSDSIGVTGEGRGFGGDGNDGLGGTDNTEIYGGAGDDTLFASGPNSNDPDYDRNEPSGTREDGFEPGLMFGGSGDDVFRFNDFWTRQTAMVHSTVGDFDRGQDILDLSELTDNLDNISIANLVDENASEIVVTPFGTSSWIIRVEGVPDLSLADVQVS